MNSETMEKFEYSFAGKKVLITGGGRGLGRQLVSRLYNDGARVFTLEKDAELVSKLLQDFPDKSRLTAEICDISNWNETRKLIESFGPMDHLINSAAVVLFSEFLDVQEDQVDKTFDVNIKSQFCTTQAVAKGMIAAGIKGTIVNVASVIGHMSCPANSVYCVTKAGVIMLTKCLAFELGKHGIRTNSVSPTFIETPMGKKVFEDDPSLSLENHAVAKRQPLMGKKMLAMDDVVNSILFLLSPLSSLSNGTDFVLDGGILAC